MLLENFTLQFDLLVHQLMFTGNKDIRFHLNCIHDINCNQECEARITRNQFNIQWISMNINDASKYVHPRVH